MGSPRAVVSVLIATTILIAGLALWVGYSKGDISFFQKEAVTGQEFPRALPTPETPTPTVATTTNTHATTTMEYKKTDGKNPVITLQTNHGNIVLELYEDVMPVTAGNFLTLAKKGFYANTKFHRVINGFMIQGGDPNSKTDKTETYGTGGPGYAIKDEFVTDTRLTNMRGTIAMANSGPDTGGSQFFINLTDNTGLDFDKPPESSSHPVFGKVIQGMDIVDDIAKVPTNERDIPREPVVITAITVE